MRVIIAGSRSIDDYDLLVGIINTSGFDITEVVCGGARGVDRMGKRWGDEHNIPVKMFPAQWLSEDGEFQRGAGHKRNIEMAEYGDALILLWTGESPGSKQMLKMARKYGLKIFEFSIPKVRIAKGGKLFE